MDRPTWNEVEEINMILIRIPKIGNMGRLWGVAVHCLNGDAYGGYYNCDPTKIIMKIDKITGDKTFQCTTKKGQFIIPKTENFIAAIELDDRLNAKETKAVLELEGVNTWDLNNDMIDEIDYAALVLREGGYFGSDALAFLVSFSEIERLREHYFPSFPRDMIHIMPTYS